MITHFLCTRNALDTAFIFFKGNCIGWLANIFIYEFVLKLDLHRNIHTDIESRVESRIMIEISILSLK